MTLLDFTRKDEETIAELITWWEGARDVMQVEVGTPDDMWENRFGGWFKAPSSGGIPAKTGSNPGVAACEPMRRNPTTGAMEVISGAPTQDVYNNFSQPTEDDAEVFAVRDAWGDWTAVAEECVPAGAESSIP